MASPIIFWWLPNLYPYPRTLSYLTDIFLTTYLTFLSRYLTGDSNQYIKIRIHHFPSYHPCSLLPLVLVNNTSNHFDTQTINPRVSLWLESLSPPTSRKLCAPLMCPLLSIPPPPPSCRIYHVYQTAKIPESNACPTTDSCSPEPRDSSFHAFFPIPFLRTVQATSLLSLQLDLHSGLSFL